MVVCEGCGIEMEYESVQAEIETHYGKIIIIRGEKVYRCSKCGRIEYRRDFKVADFT
jgi:hypothetical protein